MLPLKNFSTNKVLTSYSTSTANISQSPSITTQNNSNSQSSSSISNTNVNNNAVQNTSSNSAAQNTSSNSATQNTSIKQLNISNHSKCQSRLKELEVMVNDLRTTLNYPSTYVSLLKNKNKILFYTFIS